MEQPTRRVLVTGSRSWTDAHAVYNALDDQVDLLERGGRLVVVHGTASGADQMASWWIQHGAENWHDTAGIRIDEERHPADWRTHGRAAGPVRNQKMVDLGADVCLAFAKRCTAGGCTTKTLHMTHGTRSAIDAALAAGIPVLTHGFVDAEVQPDTSPASG